MKIKKTYVSSILFVCLFTAILVGLSAFFSPKQVTGPQAEKENTLDYLVLGDSEAYVSISPFEMWNEKGFTGYNMGKSQDYVQAGKRSLQTVLKTQNPKVILIEINFLFRDRSTVNELESSFSALVGSRLSIFNEHRNWRYLTPENIKLLTTKSEPKPNPTKGYYFQQKVVAAPNEKRQLSSQLTTPIPDNQQKALNQLLEICAENKIQVILYASPSRISWSPEQHNGVSQFAKENKLPFIDCNLLEDTIGIDWQTDTYDQGDHINEAGAKKVTHYFANYLAEHTNLEDRRNDSRYNEWHLAWREYNE